MYCFVASAAPRIRGWGIKGGSDSLPLGSCVISQLLAAGTPAATPVLQLGRVLARHPSSGWQDAALG